MNRTVIFSVTVIAIASVVCFITYSSNMRYITTNAGDGRIYKIDRRTGQSVMIIGTREIPVQQNDPPKSETPEEKALRLAKDAKTFSHINHDDRSFSYMSNNDYIRDWLKQQKGSLQIVGWETQSFGDQVYVVKYSFDQGAGPRSFILEVNLQEEIVRNVIGDPVLEMKYGIQGNH